ncbi:glycosyltransferase family 69 protein [Sodiomyces alcalophilus JCM 7366]|uniref:glycosyltransferase family 69 protein n=1 Tax=Sodiomyces alcalophilus JCM 7366 TaxID=591952 RepID=UPI0039B4E63A
MARIAAAAAIPGYRIAPRRRSLRRLFRSRIAHLILLFLFLATFFNALCIQRRIAHLDRPPAAFDVPRKQERIYIAALHWNDAALVRDYWAPAVLDLVEALGRDNVFISVYESGSWDETKVELAAFDAQLAARGVRRNIVLDNSTHQDELQRNMPAEGQPLPEGWIETSRARAEMRRIPFLARLRNLTLRDLWDLADKGERYDKILFLNDVVFSAQGALTLLDTNRGIYAAACSLDFSDPSVFYDTFALRDIRGDVHLTASWPFFRARASRAALVAHDDAVPVQSCWNGIVAMPAAPFISSAKHKRLQFRAIPDSLASLHLEASECCLIHVDNPLSRELGVYLNPRVRVTYDPNAYAAVNPAHGASWVSMWAIAKGLWWNRLLAWFTTDALQDLVVDRRMKSWQEQSDSHHEPGRICIINEGQVLVWNGWNHV